MITLDSMSKSNLSCSVLILTSDSKGEKITAKAHGGSIDIQGVTIAKVDDKVRLQAVETWFDPLEMFRQIAPSGEVTRTVPIPNPGEDITTQLHGEDEGRPPNLMIIFS